MSSELSVPSVALGSDPWPSLAVKTTSRDGTKRQTLVSATTAAFATLLRKSAAARGSGRSIQTWRKSPKSCTLAMSLRCKLVERFTATAHDFEQDAGQPCAQPAGLIESQHLAFMQQGNREQRSASSGMEWTSGW